jgi:hypothetical protein
MRGAYTRDCAIQDRCPNGQRLVEGILREDNRSSTGGRASQGVALQQAPATSRMEVQAPPHHAAHGKHGNGSRQDAGADELARHWCVRVLAHRVAVLDRGARGVHDDRASLARRALRHVPVEARGGEGPVAAGRSRLRQGRVGASVGCCHGVGLPRVQRKSDEYASDLGIWSHIG